MHATETALLAGSPRFTDPQLAQTQKTLGDAAAWRIAVQADARRAAVGVTGHFAVALHDGAGRSFLAVDRFAVHPLCYWVRDGQLHFAERADELGSAADIDPQALFDYLYFHVIPSPRTIYRGVQRLPPGHFALFENGQLTVAPYWTPEFSPVRPARFEDLRDEFRGLMQDAVARQLDGGKAACFLSGGTDSSTVAGMIGKAAGRPAATYSIGFEAQGYDEMEYARLAARHFGCDHHEYYVTPDDLVRSIPRVAASYDQPFGNSSALPAFYCAEMARNDGVSKILAGDGGDELFGGNTRYAKQKVFGWYEGVPAPLRRGLLEPLAGTGLAQALPLVKKAASYVNQAKVNMPDRMMTYNLVQHLGVAEVLTPQLLAQIDQNAPQAQQHAVWPLARGGSLVDRMLAFDWRYTLAECDLPKVVGTTSLAGVNVGFPMLDDGLLDFSLRLPPEWKVRGLKLRWFFKEALRGFLPDEILTKKKQGFGLPFGVWAHQHTALKALASDSLYSLAQRGVVREDFVRSLLDERLAQHPGFYGEMIWILMMLEQWLAAKAPSFSVDP